MGVNVRINSLNSLAQQTQRQTYFKSEDVSHLVEVLITKLGMMVSMG